MNRLTFLFLISTKSEIMENRTKKMKVLREKYLKICW